MSDEKTLIEIEETFGIEIKRYSHGNIDFSSEDFIIDDSRCFINNKGEVIEIELSNFQIDVFSSILYYLIKLKKLTSLRIIDCAISDISNINELSNIKSLSLLRNEITDFQSISLLENIEKLSISDTKINDSLFLHKLGNLRFLELSQSYITSFDVSPVFTLKNLEILKLSKTDIRNLDFIKELPQLKELYISDSPSLLIDAIKYTTNIKFLQLENCDITNLDPLKELLKLEHLYLDGNKIRDLSPLRNLVKIQSLRLIGNKIQDISIFGNLTRITSLVLNNNRISDLSVLKKLPDLEVLFISENKISNISDIKYCLNLKKINLNNNNISDISPLESLSLLETLFIDNNEIQSIEPLSKLSKLNDVWLKGNFIREIPMWLLHLNVGIYWEKYSYGGFNFYENPLQSPPPEIVKQGKSAILNFLLQIETQQEDYIFEAKMLIIGEGGAGKTSLAWKIDDPSCDLPAVEDTTRGIEVKQYTFPIHKEDFPNFNNLEQIADRKFRVNVWDFGGQEIYKATHRFFLTRRSLYVLVTDSRNENANFNYWLHMVEMFGGNSPLLIVQNERHNRKHSIDVVRLRKHFTNIRVVAKD